MDKIAEMYMGPGAFKYGLKISSFFEEDFRVVVEKGGEYINVPSGEHRVFKNDLSKHSLIIATVEKNGFFEYQEFCKCPTFTKSDLYVFLKDKGAKVEISARYDLYGDSKIDILHRVYHEADNTMSSINTRGVLRDSSYVIYRSGIDMKENLSGISGTENAKFLFLSKDAKVDAIPFLAVASRDINTSHALSISRLDEQTLFYPKLRGLSDNSARELIISGFLEQYA